MPGSFVTPTVPAVGTKATSSWADTVANDVIFLNSVPLFQGFVASAVVSIPTGAWTAMPVDTNVVDTYSGHSASGASNWQYFVPFAGWYNVRVKVRMANNATGRRGAGITINGTAATGPTPLYAQDLQPANVANTIDTVFQDLVFVPAGQYIGAIVFQDSGGALLLSGSQSVFTVNYEHS